MTVGMWKYVFLVFVFVNFCDAQSDQEIARKKFYEPFHLLCKYYIKIEH